MVPLPQRGDDLAPARVRDLPRCHAIAARWPQVPGAPELNVWVRQMATSDMGDIFFHTYKGRKHEVTLYNTGMVLEELSSQRGERDQSANRALAERCLATPGIIEQVAVGLGQASSAIIADCAGVLATVAKSRPDLVAPYAERLVPLLDHRTSKVRWQAMQALAQVASHRPELIAPLLPRLMATVEADASIDQGVAVALKSLQATRRFERTRDEANPSMTEIK